MATKQKREVFKMPNIRLRHENMFKVRPAFEEGGAEKFAATALLDPTVKEHRIITKKIMTEVTRLAVTMGFDERLVKKVYEGFISKKLHLCIGNGDGLKDEDTDEPQEGFAGMIYVKATNKTRPTVCHRNLDLIEEREGIVFAGVYGNMNIDLYTWNYKKTGRQGIGANLRSFQFTKTGDPFGRGTLSPENEFDPIDSDDDNEDEDGESWDE